MRVSVVIPVRHDADELRRLLLDQALAAAAEVIVAAPEDELDGLSALLGSYARTRLIASPPGRAAQMNAGAAAATGEWVMFLHADCRLPAAWANEIAAADRDPR